MTYGSNSAGTDFVEKSPLHGPWFDALGDEQPSLNKLIIAQAAMYIENLVSEAHPGGTIK